MTNQGQIAWITRDQERAIAAALLTAHADVLARAQQTIAGRIEYYDAGNAEIDRLRREAKALKGGL